MLALNSFVIGLSLPSRPVLKPPPLPLKLAGGLFLFGTSVPQQNRATAAKLQALAQDALRADPTVSMELGMGIEAGGIFACATSDDGAGLAINFQINGGNSWAECTAFGAVGADGLELIDLTVSNMDAALTGSPSLSISPVYMAGRPSATPDVQAQMTDKLAAARDEALSTGGVEEEQAVR